MGGKAVPLLLGAAAFVALSVAARRARARALWELSAGLLSSSPVLPPTSAKSLDERWFPYITPEERDRRFGPLIVTPNPTSTDPEAVQIRNDFAKKVVRRYYPALDQVPGSGGGFVPLHEAAAASLDAVLRDIERRGLLPLIRSFEGSWVPRYVRGSTSTLSSHAYGTAIDINARDNPQGAPPTEAQKQLARVFAEHGWFWGDWFKPTRDPMHFEYLGHS